MRSRRDGTFPKLSPDRAPDRSLRLGERFPERVLEQAAVGQPGVDHAGARSSGWRSQRARYRSGKQDGQRADEATVSRIRRWRFRTKIWNGLFGSRWNRAGASRSNRSAASRASSGIRISATRWERRASSSSFRRRNCTAMRRFETDPLPPGQVWAASTGTAGDRAGSVPGRGDFRAGKRRKDSESPGAAGVSRKREGRRAESLRAGEGTGRRPRSARARVLDSDAGDGFGQDGRRARAAECWSLCAVRCWGRTRAAGRSSSAR